MRRTPTVVLTTPDLTVFRLTGDRTAMGHFNRPYNVEEYVQVIGLSSGEGGFHVGWVRVSDFAEAMVW